MQNVSIILNQSLKLVVIAVLCPIGLIRLYWTSLWFLWCKITIFRPFYVSPTAAKCLYPPLSKRQTFCYGRPVPHRAHSPLQELLVVFVMQNHHMSTLFMCVQLLQNVSVPHYQSVKLLLWKTCDIAVWKKQVSWLWNAVSFKQVHHWRPDFHIIKIQSVTFKLMTRWAPESKYSWRYEPAKMAPRQKIWPQFETFDLFGLTWRDLLQIGPDFQQIEALEVSYNNIMLLEAAHACIQLWAALQRL